MAKSSSKPRILSRRDVFGILGSAAGAALVNRAQPSSAVPAPTSASRALPSCIVRPQQTEGPYFADVKLNRSDIRSEPSDGSAKPGIPLELEFRVLQITGNGCNPLPKAVVDLWQCDAHGSYSAFRDFGGNFDTCEKKFLRGHQITDEGGKVHFVTIFPGWYQGRTVHIHFKIRTEPDADRGFEFTSQLYFDEETTKRVSSHADYADNPMRRIRNHRDGLFRRGGDQLTLALTETEEGFTGVFEIGLDLS